jgi:hypothetical protein
MISEAPDEHIGIEHTTEYELDAIKKHLTSKKKNIQYDKNQVFYNLKYKSDSEKPEDALKPKYDNEKLERDYGTQYEDVINEYGFLSPAVMVIEDYVKFFMVRYNGTESLEEIRQGLKAEKAFDLILQNIPLPFNYPEPIRDWRRGHGAPFSQPCDFYIPCIGKVEVKSVTEYCNKRTGKFIDYRVNINIEQFKKNDADYVVVLWHIGGEFIMLCGAMPHDKIRGYINSEYHIDTNDPFWSIPLEHFMNSISGRRFCDEGLNVVKQKIAKLNNSLEPIKLRSGENDVDAWGVKVLRD